VSAAIAPATSAADQPRMQAARADLNQARAQLQQALSNKDGHRVKAIEYVNSAIAEINAGIAYDRRHNHATTLALGSVVPDQPHMQAALNHLIDAQRNLQAATSDKGGHRQKALDYVGKAINEVNKGIAAGN
jgi:multidrug resistance efflux pump